MNIIIHFLMLLIVSPFRAAVNQLHLSAMVRSGSSFSDAQDRVKTLNEDPGNQVKLRLYALYKQVKTLSVHHSELYIYTTKIDTFVCPPHISETVAVRITKLAHRPRIDSTTITLISKSILLSFFLSILSKTIQPISAGPNPYTSTDTCFILFRTESQLADM